MLHRFTGVVPGDTLYKAYKVAIEPIALYGTEVIYENFTLKNITIWNSLLLNYPTNFPSPPKWSIYLYYLVNEGVAGPN